MTGPGAVGLLEGALHRAVEDRLVPRRQLLGDGALERHAAQRLAGRPTSRGRSRWRAARCGRTRWRSTGGGRAGRPPPRPGARPACGCRGRSPTAAGSPATAAGPARRRRRRARGGVMWAWTRSRSRPASTASATSPRELLGGRLGERHAGRAVVGALEEEPLAVDRQRSSERMRTWRSPVRRRALVGRRCRPRAGSSAHLDARRRARAGSPSARGHHSAGRSTVERSTRPRSRRRRAAARPRGRGPARAVVRSVTVAGARSLSSTARSATTAPLGGRLAAQRRAGGRCAPGRSAVDADRPPDAAGVPVGVEAVPVLEHAGDVALGGLVASAARRSPRRRGGARDRAAQRLGDLEGVRDEVALGVARGRRRRARRRPGRRGRRSVSQARRPSRWRRAGRSGAGRAAGRRRRRTPGSERQWPGTAIGSQSAVVEVRSRARCGAGPRRRRRLARCRSAPSEARRLPGPDAPRIAPSGRGRVASDRLADEPTLRPATLGQLRESGWELDPGQGGDAAQRGRADPGRRAAVPERARLRGHGPAAARERAPRRPRRDLPRASAARPRPA